MAGTNPKIIKIFETCIEAMKHLGAVIVDPADVPNFDKFSKTELEVLQYEFKADLNKYLKSLDGEAQVHSLEDVIKFNEENSHKVMSYFGQERMLTAQETKSLRDKKYRCPGEEPASHAQGGHRRGDAQA
jgi:amidase